MYIIDKISPTASIILIALCLILRIAALSSERESE